MGCSLPQMPGTDHGLTAASASPEGGGHTVVLIHVPSCLFRLMGVLLFVLLDFASDYSLGVHLFQWQSLCSLSRRSFVQDVLFCVPYHENGPLCCSLPH